VVGQGEVVVLDATHGFAETTRWPFAGYASDAELGPDDRLALVTSDVANQCRVELHALDGRMLGALPLPTVLQIAWRPDGRALLVATPGEVLRLHVGL